MNAFLYDTKWNVGLNVFEKLKKSKIRSVSKKKQYSVQVLSTGANARP